MYTMKPIEILAWFELDGTPHPIRYTIDGVETKFTVVKVDEEKLAGNRMLIFHCKNDEMGNFRLKFELRTCKWFLWSM